MTENSLITKYRPNTFAEVVGQDATVRSLKKAVENNSASTFLFSGDPGTGKTTLARLTAKALGCPDNERIEIDAATNTGIDDMREITSTLIYKPLGEAKVKVLLVDEAHALSKSAVTSLLKATEEPPEHVKWILCTSEVGKLPVAIKTRAAHFTLKAVSVDDLVGLLERVVSGEKLKIAEDIIDLCAAEASGSPRQALSNLTVCQGAASFAEAKELLRSAVESKEAIDLARALFKGADWGEAQKLLAKMKEINPESARHVVRAYATTIALTSKKEADAGRALEILDAFSTPFYSSDGISPLVLASGRVLLA